MQLKAFYTEVVGLVDGFRPTSAKRGYWLYAGNHAVLHLVEDEARKEWDSSCLDHIAFKCRGLAETRARLTDNGVDFRTAAISELNQTQLFFHDPVGIGVELNFDEVV